LLNVREDFCVAVVSVSLSLDVTKKIFLASHKFRVFELPRALFPFRGTDPRLFEAVEVHLANEGREVRVLEVLRDAGLRKAHWVPNGEGLTICRP
jgi:hypothetical protein